MRTFLSRLIYSRPVAALLLLSLLACNGALGDTVRPGTPALAGYDPVTRRLTWLATGDDGDSGRGALTDIRATFRNEDVTLDSFLPENLRYTAIFADTPLPGLPETPREFLVPRLSVGRPAFLMIAQRDEVGNVGDIAQPDSVTINSDKSVFTDLLETDCPLGLTPSVASVASGDLNSVPGEDIVVGDPDNNRVLVFYGEQFRAFELLPSARFCEPDAVIDGSALGGRFGTAVSVGDVDGDHVGEVFIGAPEFDRGDGLGQRGAVFVVRVSGSRSAPGDFLSINQGPQEGYISKVKKTDPPFLQMEVPFPESIAGNQPQSWSYYGKTPMLSGSDADSIGGDSVRHLVNDRELVGVPANWLFAITSGPNNGFFCRIRIVDDTEDLPDIKRAVDCQGNVRNRKTTTAAVGQSWAIYEEIETGPTVTSVKGSPFITLGKLRLPDMVLSLTGTPGTVVPSLTLIGPPATIGTLPFGFGSVLNARGDINGDNFGDLVVGVPALDTVRWADRDVPMLERGGVFVFFGSARFVGITGIEPSPAGGSTPSGGIRDLKNLSARPELTFLGESIGDRLGTSVSAGRDLTDNSFTREAEDPRTYVLGLAMGAPFADANGRVDAGKVYAFRVENFISGRDWRAPGALSDTVYNFSDPDGGDDSVTDLTLLKRDHGQFEIWGETAGDRIGTTVDLTGDFNLDTYVDLAVYGPGSSGNGLVMEFMVSGYVVPPGGYSFDPAATGGSTSYPLDTTNMGNVDVNRRIDMDGDGVLSPYEDRCVYCILDLAVPNLSGFPQVTLLGDSGAVIAPEIYAPDSIPDGMSDLTFLVSTPDGTIPAVLNGNIAGLTPWVAPEADDCTMASLAKVLQIYFLEKDVKQAVENAIKRPGCNIPPRSKGKIYGRPVPQTGTETVLNGNDGLDSAVARDATSGRVIVQAGPLAVFPFSFERMDGAVPSVTKNTVSVVVEREPDPVRTIWGPVIATGQAPGSGYLGSEPAGFHGNADVNGDTQGDILLIVGDQLQILH